LPHYRCAAARRLPGPSCHQASIQTGSRTAKCSRLGLLRFSTFPRLEHLSRKLTPTKAACYLKPPDAVTGRELLGSAAGGNHGSRRRPGICGRHRN
jgi:hypothetical protein